MSGLHDLTLAEAGAAYVAGAATPRAMVEALLARIEQVDGRIRAWETVDAEGALMAAGESERRLAEGAARPLEGLAVGIKDIFYTAGLRTTASFPVFRDFVPSYDAAAVARLREAGAIVLGKTVTTQFAFADAPPTRNPWKLDRTPGGSSSGSGAAVAARMVPGALGSQTAGSVLRPAAYNGVVGFKPTYGRISRYGVIPLAWSLDHVGIIVRSVADVELLYRVLKGHDPRDPGSLPDATAEAPARFEGCPRLGLLTGLLDYAEPEVAAHVRGVVERLAAAGADVVDLPMPEPFELLLACQQITMQAEASEAHRDLHAQHAASYGPSIRAMVETGQLIPAALYLRAQRLRARMTARMAELAHTVNALISPTVANVAPEPPTTGDRRHQALWSLLGFPTVSLPTGLSREGLPLAVQLTAAPLGDERVLAVAAWCEEVLGRMGGPSL